MEKALFYQKLTNKNSVFIKFDLTLFYVLQLVEKLEKLYQMCLEQHRICKKMNEIVNIYI